MAVVGIIGGSGLDDNLKLSGVREHKVHTPYGPPSDVLKTGRIGRKEVVLLARHGARHQIMPSLVNYRANLWSMRELGVTHVIATTACGSLREEIAPGHFVFIDQFIDRTTKRAQTFYEGQRVCHIPMSDPFCGNLRRILRNAAGRLAIPHHDAGTVVTIEGPRFSSRAESRMFRQWGGDVINMSTVPEVVLARELGLCYAAVAMATDYDSWHAIHETVSLEMVMQTMQRNQVNFVRLLGAVLGRIRHSACACRDAAAQACF
ncbi:MAG: S-methyl-5'-thioadenosine phosphorylase [Kiritimatiellia bacterium]|nr:S-methyl-5'-thioadenosine phosphorylase [Lentisphaerota bacterium]